ncbi:HlyD family type I secretion periplasmic adaptor subunit [Steroidobacter sp. S1-65]|uniref:Membrane fusion protein (MFP) family protein n=1 Tax=Steroidobacter gossypii TaxID=2805490 RepID=A0ABS1WXP5_9GAMM|nr:HlyD family type I secretion periplasmic adaptor subunit [Steroidobacter gossypii]MBM0105749.1 HlyD family type I secretion periplasmic adaptor subunit [Steroidobacter gossypii]
MSTTSSSEPANLPAPIRIASALFEIEAGEPTSSSRIILRCLSALFVALLLWAVLARLDIVAVAQGRLVPQTYVKVVQPAEAGIIREILVEQGQTVEQGEVLVRLDATVNAAESSAVTREIALQELQLRRIEAQLAGEPMQTRAGDDATLFAQVEAQRVSHQQSLLDSVAQESAARERSKMELNAAQELLQKIESTLPSYQRTALAFEKLARQSLVSALQAEEKSREAVEKERDLEAQRATVSSLKAAISAHDKRIAQIESTYSSDLNQERLEIVARLNSLKQQESKLTFQSGLLELRAPQAGVVKDLATTTVGAVVEPGTVIVTLVPKDEPLLAEVMIENKDVGFVAVDQPVRLKLAAYQFQKYGFLEGTVKTVSADSSGPGNRGESALAADGQELAFKALIELDTQRLEMHPSLPIAAGMQVSAEIVQGERTVLEYLLSPVQRVAAEAGMER